MMRKMGRERIVFAKETYLDYSDRDHGQSRKKERERKREKGERKRKEGGGGGKKGKERKEKQKRKKQKGRGRAWEEKSTVQLRELEGKRKLRQWSENSLVDL